MIANDVIYENEEGRQRKNGGKRGKRDRIVQVEIK